MDTIKEVLNTMEAQGVNFDWTSCADSVVKEEIIKFRHCKSTLATLLGGYIPSDDLRNIVAYCNRYGYQVVSTDLHYLKSHRNDDERSELIYQLVRSYQQLKKYKSICSNIKDGKIYSHWYDNGTKTGRIISKDFNIQGLPRICRPFVVADEGCKILTADYSNIELRLLADFSQDVNLLSAFEHDEDIHKLTASKVFAKPLDSITDIERSVAKKINFGVVYGVTPFGLQRMLKEDLKIDISINEAQGYIDSFYQNYSNLRPYFNKVLNLEEYQSIENPRSRMNYPIQHGCAVGFKNSIIKLYDSMPKSWRIICLLHDEIALQVPSSDVQEAKELLEKSMIEGMKIVSPNVKISVDIAVGDSWLKV